MGHDYARNCSLDTRERMDPLLHKASHRLQVNGLYQRNDVMGTGNTADGTHFLYGFETAEQLSTCSNCGFYQDIGLDHYFIPLPIVMAYGSTQTALASVCYPHRKSLRALKGTTLQGQSR